MTHVMFSDEDIETTGNGIDAVLDASALPEIDLIRMLVSTALLRARKLAKAAQDQDRRIYEPDLISDCDRLAAVLEDTAPDAEYRKRA